MSTSPFPKVIEPGDFDPHSVRPPILDGMTPEVCREMSALDRMRRVAIAWGQVKQMHREWYLEKEADEPFIVEAQR